MTIAQIEGGIGSQMFGYAAARRLALVHGAQVHIDPRNYRTYKKFKPELHHFDVDADLLSGDEADRLCGIDNSLIPVVQPRHLHFDSAILEVSTPYVLMRGNYVCEDYFFDVRDIVRKDFTRVTEPDAYGKETAALLEALAARGYEPVSVHVRRGDYVNEAGINAIYGTCTFEYYEMAMALIRRLVDNPWFVFFSNDPEWIRAHFAGDNRTITQVPPSTAPIEDLMLMASCRHHVLANSGYSIWGAWLAEHPDQVVIGPRPWLQDRTMNTEDLLRRNWISLGNREYPSPTNRFRA